MDTAVEDIQQYRNCSGRYTAVLDTAVGDI
jgi:hypothetical protein